MADSGSIPDSSLVASRAARVTLVMACLFGTTGVILVFLPRWLEVERHLSGAEIGAVLALAQFGRILTGPAVAYWADGVADRRTPLRVVSFAALLAYGAFFFAPSGFWPLLVLGFIALSLTQVMTPLIEAATLRATAEGKITYGVARGIGSVAFICANLAGGLIVARFGVGAIVVWVLLGLAATTSASVLGLRPDQAPPIDRTRVRRSGASALLRDKRFLILIVACGLIQSGHAFYYGFSTLVWRGQGISAEMVGVLWAFGVAVEVVFLLTLAPIERRLSPELLILIGGAGGALRWVFMGFAPTGFVLWPLQALHALSFAAAHVGAMRLLFRDTPESAAAMGQTLYATLSGGILMGAATLMSGVLYDAIGAGGYWAMAMLALLGASLSVLLLRPPTRTHAATRP